MARKKVSLETHDIILEKFWVRWYKYNKRKIPLILMAISLFFFTAFLDTKEFAIPIESHFRAISFLTSGNALGNFTPVAIFLMYLISIIQTVFAFNYSKTGSRGNMIFINVLSIIQTVLLVFYVLAFINQMSPFFMGWEGPQNPYTINAPALLSISVFAVGLVFMIAASVFTWFYVNKRYVKEKD